MIGWTTFGSSVAPIVLLVFGLLLAGSSAKLSSAIAADPIGALTTLLPTWFLVPFAIVAVLGLVGGSVLDIYSSGLALLTLGLRIPRYAAALIDGVVMILGTIYVVFVAKQLPAPVRGLPDHPGRAHRRLVRRHAGRHRAAAQRLLRGRTCTTGGAGTATSGSPRWPSS